MSLLTKWLHKSLDTAGDTKSLKALIDDPMPEQHLLHARSLSAPRVVRFSTACSAHRAGAASPPFNNGGRYCFVACTRTPTGRHWCIVFSHFLPASASPPARKLASSPLSISPARDLASRRTTHDITATSSSVWITCRARIQTLGLDLGEGEVNCART